YKVPTSGGVAQPLTIHSAWEGYPIWSRDGRQIAFASDRHGNLDVFVMPASGGKATRLTYYSANDIPTDFSADGKAVLFNSTRVDSVTSSIFPSTRLSELYQITVAGGTPRMISTIPGSEARYSPDGNQLLYRDEKAYESSRRKHDTSAFARDIWLFDLKSGEHKQLTNFNGGDHTPVWANANTIYYLSEQGENNFNVWRMDAAGGQAQQVSQFDTHPVRSLSISDNGILAYIQHGSIYTHQEGTARRLLIKIATDAQENDEVLLTSLGKINEFAVSANGKEIAFVARGEIFVTSTEFATTKQITNTPGQERDVSFHKDGRTLLYAAERNGRWGIYESSIANKSERYFFTATVLKEKAIHVTDNENFQPVYSPDGKKIAFLTGRDEIQVLNRTNGKVNIALGKKYNYSYADGDIAFKWSPDSRWLTADYAPRGRLFIGNIAVFPADGSAPPVDISHSGYADTLPFWHKDGAAVLWFSSRYGQRDHGSWGREFDVMASFLTQDAYDKFTLTKEEYELLKELAEENKKAKDSDKKKKREKAEIPVPELKIEWEDLDDRMLRLTIHSSDLADAAITKDSGKLYYLAKFEHGYDLWEEDFREETTILVAKLEAEEASMHLSADDKKIYILADGKLQHGELGKATIKLEPVEATPSMMLKPAQERAHIFEHAWRQVKDKFYNPNMHGIDWDAMKKAYQQKLPSIGNNRDLAGLMEEMTGELNASHIGAYYRPKPKKNNDKTAALGLIFDLSDTSGALTIAEVLDKSPLEKAKSQIRAGMKLLAIDGIKLDGKTNLAALLNKKAGKRVRLAIRKKNGDQFEEVTKPIPLNEEAQLLYQRWVKQRKALVDKLSKSRLAYVHIRSMNDPSFRAVYSDLLGQYFDKEAVVIDTRWNGGGWLHNDLAKLFMGKHYFTMHVRGRQYFGDPMDQWAKPSILVMGEGNYSDAHAFPYAYDALGIGDMVGMPVPGTMTAVWWETTISGDIRFGVPQVGMKNLKGEYLENNQLEPDHRVKNDPESSAAGQDRQIAKAVELLLKQLDAN
ncbi:MAG: S41 family peptidase, partial [Pseudomonadota bacterium]